MKQNPRWSSSRFSCYETCKTKYFLQYIRQLVVTGRDAEVTQKGLSFHEIAEQMTSTTTLNELYEIAKKNLETAEFDQEKYPVIRAIPRFYLWWQTYIKPLEDEGYTLTTECWEYSKIAKKALCGAMDIILHNPKTNDVVIIDFKTSQSAKADSYKNQLMLYVYMVAKRLKIKLKDANKKIKTYLFFPLADLKNEDIDDPKSTEKYMNKTYKQLIFDAIEIEEMLDKYEKIVTASEETDWEQFNSELNASMHFGCSWCGFLGHPEHCVTSYKNGYKFPRKAKIYEKAEFDKMKKEAAKED